VRSSASGLAAGQLPRSCVLRIAERAPGLSLQGSFPLSWRSSWVLGLISAGSHACLGRGGDVGARRARSCALLTAGIG